MYCADTTLDQLFYLDDGPLKCSVNTGFVIVTETSTSCLQIKTKISSDELVVNWSTETLVARSQVWQKLVKLIPEHDVCQRRS